MRDSPLAGTDLTSEPGRSTEPGGRGAGERSNLRAAWARLGTRRRAERGQARAGDSLRGDFDAAANPEPTLSGSPRETRSLLSRDGSDGTPASGGIGFRAIVACVGVVGLTGATALIGVTSSIVDRPAVFVTLRVVGCLGMVAVVSVGLARGSSGRLASLLLAIAFAFALNGLTGATAPGLFVIGRITIPLTIMLLMYFCVAYPDGRINAREDSILLAFAAVGFGALLVGDLLVSRVPPVAGPFVRCSDGACPANPLNVIELPEAGRALSTALALWTAITLAATAILAARRLANATRLQRRGLSPQLAWAVLITIGYGFFIAVRAVDAHARLLTPAAVVVAAVIAALPLAIAVGMARGRVLTMSGLEHMIARLGEHPTLAEMQHTMSRAFGDPTLQLLIWRASSQRYADIDGQEAQSLTTAPGRQLTRFTRDGTDFAAVAHDPYLADERDVLTAAGSAVSLALDNARLSADLSASIAELEASRKRLASAADQERRRIEQNLHDGAQQGLIALRIKLGLLAELAADDAWSLAPLLIDAGDQIDTAIDQIRKLAHGIYPSELRDLGLAGALAAVARELPITVALHADLTRRLAPEVEAAVYFCCVEALQNVAKHCGAQAQVNLCLTEHPDGVEFMVADNGPGFDPTLITSTQGTTGMRDRLAAVGGALTINSTRGRGTTVTGQVLVGVP